MQAVGRFIFSLLASLAEFDRATMLGRTSMGVRRLANQGKFISGPIPFGFAVGADGFLQPSEQLVDPLGTTEAELVVDIFRRVADGQSSQKVATWLNRIGVPATKRYWKKELQRTVHAPSGALGWSAVRVRGLSTRPSTKASRTLSRQQRYPQRCRSRSSTLRCGMRPTIRSRSQASACAGEQEARTRSCWAA